MEKEQGKLIIIVSVVFAMVLLCMICTSDSVPEVKSLQECTPDAVSVLDDGRELYDFILDQNDDETNSIVFYSTHQEIAVYAERVQRMFGMVADLLHEKEGSEAYLKLYNRIEKYEQICDRMELEIAGFLNLVVGGRLSYEGKMMVNSMLTIVTEIESIGDCCYNLARTLQRKQDSHIDFNDEIVSNIDAMFKLDSEALSNMVALLSSNEPLMSEIMISYNKECEINNYRNQLRGANVENINNKHYEYQSGIYYMDMISECERLGDYVINVVDAIKQQQVKHA